MHAIIDNFSRRILAWCVDPTFDTGATSKLIVQAAKGLKETTEHAVPQVYMDRGVENINAEVAALIETNAIQRVLAQVDIHFSSSMIESWWRQLKRTVGGPVRRAQRGWKLTPTKSLLTSCFA